MWRRGGCDSNYIPLLVSYHHHRFFIMSSQSTPHPSSPMDASEMWLQNHMCKQMEAMAMELDVDEELTVPFIDSPQLISLQGTASPANSPKFYPPWVFMETLFSQHTPSWMQERAPQGSDQLKAQMPPMGTLGSCAESSLPRAFASGLKLVKKKAPSGDLEALVFDIINTFQHRWFLSVVHLRAQALSAQKVKDGSIFWVEFTPQFHTHLVKCAVALVPWPIRKVKKVMFVYILELLNKEGQQAFFNLSKGEKWATTAQKEKKRLARKRNHALR